ncbi:MAG: MFS transporter [Alphaproteobacteria bacterium]
MASGFASTGVGVSILVLPPLVALLIDWYDWRLAMRTSGVMALSMGTLAALMMGDPGRTSALLPSDNIEAGRLDHRFELRAALTSRSFVMCFLSSVFRCVGFFFPLVHIFPYAIDRGLG